MIEYEVKIPLSSTDLYIYGVLRGSYSDPLIILCHGYGGWMHEMLLYNGARFFEKDGFSTLRLSMYGGGENSRNISQSDVMTHASDIDDVVTYVKSKGASWVGVAGHSYSGLAITYSSKQEFDAAALWDPTHTDGYDDPQAIKSLEKDFLFVDKLNAYVSGLGSGYIYAKSVYDNDYPKSNEMASKFTIPTCVINASWSKKQKKYGKAYVDNISAHAKQVIIPDSTHPFTGDGAAEKLFAETSRFFKSLQ
jgi:pimeloyl-ACP methyl ester carboxylesterase